MREQIEALTGDMSESKREAYKHFLNRRVWAALSPVEKMIADEERYVNEFYASGPSR